MVRGAEAFNSPVVQYQAEETLAAVMLNKHFARSMPLLIVDLAGPFRAAVQARTPGVAQSGDPVPIPMIPKSVVPQSMQAWLVMLAALSVSAWWADVVAMLKAQPMVLVPETMVPGMEASSLFLIDRH